MKFEYDATSAANVVDDQQQDNYCGQQLRIHGSSRKSTENSLGQPDEAQTDFTRTIVHNN